MKIFLCSILTLLFLATNAQADSTSNFKGKWGKFKEKAQEKIDALDEKLKESGTSDNSAKKKQSKKTGPATSKIGANQHIDAKAFTVGDHPDFSVVEEKWKDYGHHAEVRAVELNDQGDVITINIYGVLYEMERGFNGIDWINTNTYFYNKKYGKYAVYFDNSFITYKVSSRGEVTIVTASGAPSINPVKMKEILEDHRLFSNELARNIESMRYESVSQPNEINWRRVKRDGKYGFINEENQVIVPLEYDKINDFSEGLAWVLSGEKWSLMDARGKIISETNFNSISAFKNGKAAVSEGNKVGFVDKNLKEEWIYKNGEYDFIYDYGKVYKTTKDGNSGLVTSSGETVLECEYIIDGSYVDKDGLLIVTGQDKLVGYFKVGHGWITERVYKHAKIAHNSIYRNGKPEPYDQYYIDIENPEGSNPYYLHGFVSPDGTIEWTDGYKPKTPPNKYPKKDKLPWRESYSARERVVEDHLVAVRDLKVGKSGVIDYNGKVIVEAKYIKVWDFYPEYYLFTGRETAIVYDAISRTYSEPIEVIDEEYRKQNKAYMDKYSYNPNGNSGSSSSSSSSSSNSSSTNSSSSSSASSSSSPSFSGSITLKNDTGTEYHVWIGSGSGWMNGSGATKSSSCAKGGKVYYATTNKSGDKKLLFEMTPEMCGKTIKLSKHL